MTDFKKCLKCGINKPIEQFYELKKGSGSYRSVCIKCYAESQKKYYESRKRGRSANVIEAKGCDHELATFTNRMLLSELKARGYIWSDMKLISKVPYDAV